MKVRIICLALLLAGCGTIVHINGEEAQEQIDQRFIGMRIGDFFDRYGPPISRAEANDGSRAFIWEDAPERTPAGPEHIEESICRLRIVTDPQGRIASVPIIHDAKGRRHLSLCLERLTDG